MFIQYITSNIIFVFFSHASKIHSSEWRDDKDEAYTKKKKERKKNEQEQTELHTNQPSVENWEERKKERMKKKPTTYNSNKLIALSTNKKKT